MSFALSGERVFSVREINLIGRKTKTATEIVVNVSAELNCKFLSTNGGKFNVVWRLTGQSNDSPLMVRTALEPSTRPFPSLSIEVW